MNLRNIIIAFSLILTLLCIVTACDKEDKHEHRFAVDWSFDETNHWRGSTCNEGDDCADAKIELSEHIMDGGSCQICGFSTVSDGDDDNNGDGSGNNNGSGNVGDGDGSGTPIDPDNGGNGDNNGDGGDNGDGKDDPVCTEHQYSSEQTKAPTCTEQGENLFVCALCGDSYTEAIESLGHVDESVPGKAPTCTDAGYSGGKKCSVCGEITKAQVEISALGHRYSEDGVCSVCGDPDPDFVVVDPYAIHITTTDNYCWVDKVSFTATESGEYTFRLPAGLGAWRAEDYEGGNKGPVIDALHPNYVAGEFSFSELIREGDSFEFYVGSTLKQDWTLYWSFVACEVSDETEIEIEPVELVIGNNSFGRETIVYSFTAPKDDELVLTSSVAIYGSVVITYTVNGGEAQSLEVNSIVSLDLLKDDVVIITVVAEGYSSINAAFGEDEVGGGSGEVTPPEDDPDDETDNFEISGEYIGTDAFGNKLLTVTIDSEAKTVVFYYYHHLTGPNTVNATYKIRNGNITLYDESGKILHPLSGTLTLENGVPIMASFDGTQYSLSLGIPESGGGSGGSDEIVIRGEMIDEVENTFNITASEIANDKMYVSFIPVNDGVYDFLSDHIFVEFIMTEDGVEAEKNMYDFYVLKSYVKYIVEINLEYIARAGNYSLTPVYQYPEGHPNNPIWYPLGEYVTAHYQGDFRPVWYQFYADVTGKLTVTTDFKGATVMIAAVTNFDLAAIETISLDVVAGRKYYIGIAAYDSTEPVDITFKASVTEGEITTDGSINTPHIFELGTSSFDLAAYEGMYFVYKSAGNGTLTLSANSTGFKWCFTDLLEPAIISDDKLTVHLNLGDLVYLYIEADADITDAVSFEASFLEDAKETWVPGPFILDGSAPNVIEIEEGTYALLQITRTIGRFVVIWDNPDAIVYVDNQLIKSGDVINVTSPWFGPYIKICIDGNIGGTVNLGLSAL